MARLTLTGTLKQPLKENIRSYTKWIKHRMQVTWLLTIDRTKYDLALAELPRISGPAIVVGSAPDPHQPAGIDDTWFRISINASQLVLEQFGLPPPHLTIFQSLIKESHRNRYWKALRGRETGHVVFIVNSRNDGMISEFLERQSYRAYKVTPMSHLVRKAVIADLAKHHLTSTDSRELSVSNGIFATMLALKLGAEKVVLSGFSLEPGWAHEPAITAVRNHQKMDRLACQLMVRHNLPVYASDLDFAAKTGLKLWQESFANGQ